MAVGTTPSLLPWRILTFPSFRPIEIIAEARPLGAAGWIPIIVSAVVGTVGMVLAMLSRQDNKRREAARTSLDTLTLGQHSIVEALDRATADNARLRAEVESWKADYVKQQHEHEATIRGWQSKVEDQEDELLALRIKVQALEKRLGLE